jgi:phage-related protein
VKHFEIQYLPEALIFIESQDSKARRKILYNISLSSQVIDANLFKKLNDEIWEFRTLYNKRLYRLLAFWDKEQKAIVICTHGFEKKTNKTPTKEIRKAENIRKQYFESKKT